MKRGYKVPTFCERAVAMAFWYNPELRRMADIAKTGADLVKLCRRKGIDRVAGVKLTAKLCQYVVDRLA